MPLGENPFLGQFLGQGSDRAIRQAMPKPPNVVAVRVSIPLTLYERVSEYRHQARHETRAQALTALLAAGLAAMAQPVAVPAQATSGKNTRSAQPDKKQ